MENPVQVHAGLPSKLGVVCLFVYFQRPTSLLKGRRLSGRSRLRAGWLTGGCSLSWRPALWKEMSPGPPFPPEGLPPPFRSLLDLEPEVSSPRSLCSRATGGSVWAPVLGALSIVPLPPLELSRTAARLRPCVCPQHHSSWERAPGPRLSAAALRSGTSAVTQEKMALG